MASTVNTEHLQGLLLEENAKALKQSPDELVRVCDAYRSLDDRFAAKLRRTETLSAAFERDSASFDGDGTGAEHAWTAMDEAMMRTLHELRQSEEEALMFADEKIALLESHIEALDGFVSKMSIDLDAMRPLLQPNVVALRADSKKQAHKAQK